MTEHELRVCFEIVYKMIRDERGRRTHFLRTKPDLEEKLAECDNAIIALVIMKDELKKIISPGPIQEVLIDVPTTKKAIGGY